MFDFTNLESGIGKLFGEIDYGKVGNANEHYKKILNNLPIPLPDFAASIDKDRLMQKLVSGEKLTVAERAYDILGKTEPELSTLSRNDRLTAFRNVTALFPKDLGLQLRIARQLIRIEHYSDATYYLWRCLHIDEKCADAWARLALIAALARDHGQAAYCARKALENGEHLHTSMHKAFSFSLLMIGVATSVSEYNNWFLFDTHPIAPGELAHQPPDIEYVSEPSGILDKPAVLFACEDSYFERFGKNLLRSLIRARDLICVHVHLMRPSKQTLEWLCLFSETYDLDIIITRENTPDKLMSRNAYLASSRYMLVADFILKHQTPYLVVDTDTILNSPEALQAFLQQSKKPTAFHADGPAWDTITAAFIYLPYSQASLNIAVTCQRYLYRMFFSDPCNSYWYIDQMALLGACLNNAEDVMLVNGKKVSCIDCSDEAIFWFLSNDKTVQKYWDFCASLLSEFPMPD